MDSSIRRMLWGAFAALVVLVGVGLALTITVLEVAKQQESRLVHGSQPLTDAVHAMDIDVMTIISAARGYTLTNRTEFLQQYDDAVRDFEKWSGTATQLAQGKDAQLVAQFKREFYDIKKQTDKEIVLTKE